MLNNLFIKIFEYYFFTHLNAAAMCKNKQSY